MVEFCKGCGISLPDGDLTVREGEIFTSHDYVCLDCGQRANPLAVVEPEEGKDIIIKDGNILLE